MLKALAGCLPPSVFVQVDQAVPEGFLLALPLGVFVAASETVQLTETDC